MNISSKSINKTKTFLNVFGGIASVFGLILFIIGLIMSIIMPPMEEPNPNEEGNVMLIGIIAILIIFQFLPYFIMLFGGMILLPGVAFLVIGNILKKYSNYTNQEIIEKSKIIKTFKIIFIILMIINFIIAIASFCSGASGITLGIMFILMGLIDLVPVLSFSKIINEINGITINNNNY